MHHLDLTFASPEANLACDEAILEMCEETGTELLRFWEPQNYFVVVGYANRVESEVNLQFCREHGIPILRRSTGGGTVLQGPGCLNYSLVLRFGDSGPLSTITGTNAFVLQRSCGVLSDLLNTPVSREGQTDIAVNGLKCSGNAQRRRKEYLLFHGTFLLRFDLNRIQGALPFPSRQPEYRRNRSHLDFLTNLGLSAANLKEALAIAWGAHSIWPTPPQDKVRQLSEAKYSRPEWNFKF